MFFSPIGFNAWKQRRKRCVESQFIAGVVRLSGDRYLIVHKQLMRVRDYARFNKVNSLPNSNVNWIKTFYADRREWEHQGLRYQRVFGCVGFRNICISNTQVHWTNCELLVAFGSPFYAFRWRPLKQGKVSSVGLNDDHIFPKKLNGTLSGVPSFDNE